MNFGKIITKLSPSKKDVEALETITKTLKKELIYLLDDYSVKILVGGSVAKDTFLETRDIDIFVKFPEDTKDISRKLIHALKKKYRIRVMHGSRDYVNFTYKKHNVEIIPVLDIDPKEAKNTMDVSPYHVNYIKKNLINSNEVRLLKQFCKNNGIYGAESYMSGYSGYLLELLIIKYKTFANLIFNVSKWQSGIFIDLMNYYSSKREANASIEKTPLMVIDPVLKKRNVAASVSEEMFARFIFLCKSFLREPTNKFFFKKHVVTVDKLKKESKKRETKLFIYKHKIKKHSKERELSKLKRKMRKIKRQLEVNDFIIYSYGLLEDGIMYFEIYNPILPPIKKTEGPPVWVSEKNFNAFMEKHYVEKHTLVADIKRKHISATKLLDELVKS